MPRKKACLDWDVVGQDLYSFGLSPDAQRLYQRLQFFADSEGALTGLRTISNGMGLQNYEQLYKELLSKEFLLRVGNVLFIRHWWVNNNRDSCNHVNTTHQKERARLDIDANRVYFLLPDQNEEQSSATAQSASSLTAALPQTDSSLNPDSNRKEKNSGSEGRKGDFRSRKRDCPSCGEIGQLVDEGGAMMCHACGAAYPFGSPEYQQRFGSTKRS